MIIDWFVLLAPLVLLPIVALLVFIGCAGPPFTAAPPGLQVNTINLFRTQGFTATWTFFKGGAALNPVIQRPPMGSPPMPFPPGSYSDPNNFTQSTTLAVQASPSDPDMQQVLALGPDTVQCACIAIGGIDGSTNNVPSNQAPTNYPGMQTTTVWNLTRNPVSPYPYALNLQM